MKFLPTVFLVWVVKKQFEGLNIPHVLIGDRYFELVNSIRSLTGAHMLTLPS